MGKTNDKVNINDNNSYDKDNKSGNDNIVILLISKIAKHILSNLSIKNLNKLIVGNLNQYQKSLIS